MSTSENQKNGETNTGVLEAEPQVEKPAPSTRASAISVAPKPEGADYPIPQALLNTEQFIWNEDNPAVENYRALGERLAVAADVYRCPRYASGLLMASEIAVINIDTGSDLAPVIADRVRVRYVKGNTQSTQIPGRHLNIMLRSEAFLQSFRPLDGVTTVPFYLPNFELMKPGFNDGGPGQRFLYSGSSVQIDHGLDAIKAFLNTMDFATEADATNAVALALTVMLRNFWPGAKPVAIVTSVKSHGGKETIIYFASGHTLKVSLDYESTDWAFRSNFISTLKFWPDAGVVNIENVRLFACCAANAIRALSSHL